MYSQNDALVAVIYWIVGLLILWLIIYSAVRAAAGHALDRRRPMHMARAEVEPDRVRIVVTNSGSAAAFDVVMGWSDDAATYPLARTPLLAADGHLEAVLPWVPVPGETPVVRILKVEWRTVLDPASARPQLRLPVLVPARLSVAPPAAGS